MRSDFNHTRYDMGPHKYAMVPAARFQAAGPETARNYPHGAIICSRCLKMRAAKPGETDGLPDVLDVWAREEGCAEGRGTAKTYGARLNGQWSLKYDACRNINCETPDAPHYGHGYCYPCYSKLIRGPRCRKRYASARGIA